MQTRMISEGLVRYELNYVFMRAGVGGGIQDSSRSIYRTDRLFYCQGLHGKFLTVISIRSRNAFFLLPSTKNLFVSLPLATAK